jgi:hypothetical protein
MENHNIYVSNSYCMFQKNSLNGMALIQWCAAQDFVVKSIFRQIPIFGQPLFHSIVVLVLLLFCKQVCFAQSVSNGESNSVKVFAPSWDTGHLFESKLAWKMDSGNDIYGIEVSSADNPVLDADVSVRLIINHKV